MSTELCNFSQRLEDVGTVVITVVQPTRLWNCCTVASIPEEPSKDNGCKNPHFSASMMVWAEVYDTKKMSLVFIEGNINAAVSCQQASFWDTMEP